MTEEECDLINKTLTIMVTFNIVIDLIKKINED